jgi:serine/threonine-protein phosphatase 6 regulatory ankyrin repeat subunit B
MHALKNNKTEIANHLLEKGANPYIVSKNNETPLMNVVCCGDFTLLKKLLQNKAYINFQNKTTGHCALFYAVICGNYGAIKFLLESGANPNLIITADEMEGFTPLIYASIHDKKMIVELLLKNGAKNNIRDKQGYTAFEYAVIDSRYDLVEIFLSNNVISQYSYEEKNQIIKKIVSKNDHQMIGLFTKNKIIK